MKIIKNPMFTFVIGIIISSTVLVGASYLYHANEVSYKNTTVEAAINNLYDSYDTLNKTLLYENANPVVQNLTGSTAYTNITLNDDVSNYRWLYIEYNDANIISSLVSTSSFNSNMQNIAVLGTMYIGAPTQYFSYGIFGFTTGKNARYGFMRAAYTITNFKIYGIK